MTDLALEIQALEKEYASGVKALKGINLSVTKGDFCLLYTSPSPRDLAVSRMPSSA